jgi:hypothetical protein
MTSGKLDKLLDDLVRAKGSWRCSDLIDRLEALGFQVRDGRTPGHKIVTHPSLAAFYSASFNCGHGKNPEIKSGYISNIRNTLVTHEKALREFLKEEP